ncbi:DUF397 domain-containing protein [Streptomyces sp. NPDC048442]|uniref:DUF397 domain-containing protein n=1 Tax=Streptomyces sp. NPDC048442 TaxID=3154823 RepID=UPI00341EDEFE
MHALKWQKSTYSEDQANCVNVAAAPDGTLRLRESDDPAAVLTATTGQLAALIGHLTKEAQG